MRTTPRSIKLLAATIAVLLTAQAAVLATTSSGGPLTAMKAVTQDDLVTTPSLEAVEVRGMSLAVRVPEGEHAQFLISFASESLCRSPSRDTWCFVEVLVDGVPASPGRVRFDGAADGRTWESNSMHWVSGPVAPGGHTVTVTYSADEGGRFSLDNRTLTVLRSRV